MSTVSIRYIIDDVPAAIQFYTTHLGFALDHDASPAFASVTRVGQSFQTKYCAVLCQTGRLVLPDR